MTVTLLPRLVAQGAAEAIEFWKQAFGAEEVARYTNDKGAIVHAELAIGEARFTTKDEDTVDRSPASLGGTSVLLMLSIEGVDALAERVVSLGGTVVYPIADSDEGGRGGRVRDPFGHEWMISERMA